MKYAIIFEDVDYDFGVLMSLLNQKVDVKINQLYSVSGTLRKIPDRMPCNVYNFETYTNGYAKGNNDVLDKLEGKFGEYDPKVDKL